MPLGNGMVESKPCTLPLHSLLAMTQGRLRAVPLRDLSLSREVQAYATVNLVFTRCFKLIMYEIAGSTESLSSGLRTCTH